MKEYPPFKKLGDHIGRFRGGDIELLDESSEEFGRLYRLPIARVSRGSKEIVVVPGGTAYFQPVNAGSSWYPTKPRITPIIFEAADTSLEVTDGLNGQLDFSTHDKKGTFYPPGQTLSPQMVKGRKRTPNLTLVKK